MNRTTAILICIFFYITCASQTKRDITIVDTIQVILYAKDVSEQEYFNVKEKIRKLENENGYEPEYKYRLLEKSYLFKDLDFFKNELSTLVEFYGFDVAYMSEKETYFNAIMSGELKDWFKEMYLNKHFIWLKNNFEKQIDLRKLNEIEIKNQCVNRFSGNISLISSLDSIQKRQLTSKLSDYFFTNVQEIYSISKKINNYPTGKNFALIQNHFGIAEIHNFQFKENFIKSWDLLYPFYKKSYLNNEITYIHFRNHDNFSYLHYGYQVFGLINIEDIPEEYRKSNNQIPIKDIKFKNEIKKEFKW